MRSDGEQHAAASVATWQLEADILFDMRVAAGAYANIFLSRAVARMPCERIAGRAYGAFVLLVAAGAIAACSGPELVSAHVVAGGTQAGAVADWNDIDAAVDVGVSEAEMAVVSAGDTPEGGRAYKLRTIRDEPGWLVISRRPESKDRERSGGEGDGDGESIPLELIARVGHFGDARSERRVIRAVRSRLEALHGVATRPVD